MGIDNDLVRAIYPLLIEQFRNAYKKYVLSQGRDEQFAEDQLESLGLDESKIHTDVLPKECLIQSVIIDVTSDIQRYINNEKNVNVPCAKRSDLCEINEKMLILHGTSVLNVIEAIYPLSSKHRDQSPSNLILLIDAPSRVVCSKAAEHTKRNASIGQNASKPCTLEQLQVMDIKNYNDGSVKISEFGKTSIWARNFGDLWKTRDIKPIIGEFFMNCFIKAVHLHGSTTRTLIYDRPQSSNAKHTNTNLKFNVFAQGCWDDKVIITHTNRPEFTKNMMTDLSSLMVPIPEAIPGEADVQATSWIDPRFGKHFMLISDDSDYQLIFLLHYMNLALRGVHPNQMPTIWIDRSWNSSVKNSKKNEHWLYINIYELFLTICGAHGIFVFDWPTTQNGLRKIGQVITSFVTIMISKGCDFSEPFVTSFYEPPKHGVIGYGGDDKINSKLLDDFVSIGVSENIYSKGDAMDVEDAEMMAHILGKPASKVKSLIKKEKNNIEKVAKKAPDFFSIPNMGKYVGNKQWLKCFEQVRLDITSGMVIFDINPQQLAEVFIGQLNTNAKKKYPLRKEYHCEQVKRINWILGYWTNTTSQMHKATLDPRTSLIPFRYHCAFLDPNKNGETMHGYKLVPLPWNKDDNGTSTIYIGFDEQELRDLVFDKNDEKAAESTFFTIYF